VKIQNPEQLPRVHLIALWIALIALVAKEFLFRYMLAVAEKIRSSMLIANAMNTNGLGATGNLTAPFNAGGDALSNFATSLVSSQAQQSADVTSNLTTEQALQSSLNAKVASVSGVNMDSEMSQMLSLQQAYSANARVISAVQSMFTQLLQAVQ